MRFKFEHLVNFRPCGLLFGKKEYTILYNNSDYLKKARKYGHFTGYKN